MLACVFSTATGDIKLVPLHWLYLLMPKKEVKVAATPAKTVVKAFCNAKIKKAVLVNFVGDPRTFGCPELKMAAVRRKPLRLTNHIYPERRDLCSFIQTDGT